MNEKPRASFCWECGLKLWGNHFEEMTVEGHPRILHKQCAKDIKEGNRSEFSSKEEILEEEHGPLISNP